MDAAPSADDCLCLNAWAPDRYTGTPRPVLVWFHGGAFAWGSVGATVHDGADPANVGDLVVVFFNDRPNIFGYLWLGDVLPGLKADAPGHQDLVAALRWVRESSAAFGGDLDGRHGRRAVIFSPQPDSWFIPPAYDQPNPSSIPTIGRIERTTGSTDRWVIHELPVERLPAPCPRLGTRRAGRW
ncbi:carboxylesterase family protein [Streptomyces sp. MBT53]|nr:carboxylesterase family protein [Streptomyces sp. MBT53]